MTGPITATGANSEATIGPTRIAQAFVPDRGGTAGLVSFWAQCIGINCAATAAMEIHADGGGRPGARLGGATAPGLRDSTGASPTCAVIPEAPRLAAGTTYWAVMRPVSGDAAWLFQSNAARTVLLSGDGAAWRSGPLQKTFSLRIEDGSACGPDAVPNPTAGTTVGGMIAKPGGTSFQTITIGNRGNDTLRLLGAAFSGRDAASFRLLDQQPGPLANPLRFPRTVAASPQAVQLMYVVCDGALPDGRRTATLTLTTDDPDARTIAWPVTCLVDASPPTIEFRQIPSGRNGWWDTSPALLTARGVDPEWNHFVKRILCTDTLGPTRDVPASIMNLQPYAGDGIHVVSCTATDVADNVSRAFTVEVKIDTVAPVPVFDSTPAAASNDPGPSIAFHAIEATSGVERYRCRLDRGDLLDECASPRALGSLADGPHSFLLRAVDGAGHVSAPIVHEWVVDTVAPETTLAGGPEPLTTASSAAFRYAGDALGGTAVARLECSLDGAAFAACPAGGQTLDGLAPGAHAFEVRAVDAAGDADASPARHAWTIDRTGPATTFASGPQATTTETTASIAFSAADAAGAGITGFECSLDGAEFAACTSPLALSGLAAGDHVLLVRAFDALGNIEAPAAAYRWTVAAPGAEVAGGRESDRTAPVLRRLRFATATFRAAARGGSTGRGVRLRFELSEAATVTFSVQKRVGKRWRAVRGTFTVKGRAGANALRFSGRLAKKKLAVARYRLVAVAADAAGNRSTTLRASFRIRR